MALVARLTSYADSKERRLSNRRTLRLEVPLSSGAPENNALVYNLSERGLLLESAAAIAVGDLLIVEMPETGAVAAEVIWMRDGFAGCRFDRPLSNGAVSAALLRSLPQQRPSVADNVPALAQRPGKHSDTDSDWVKTLAIVALVVAAGIATLFIVALFSAPFAAG